METNTFAFGVTSMARNCLPAVSLVRKGDWTLDDMEKWLQAVITNDKGYLDEVMPKLEGEFQILVDTQLRKP